MNAFSFNTVPSLICEWGGAPALGRLLASRFAARRALIVTFASFVRRGRLAPVLAGLEKEGFSVAVYDKVIADPPEQLVQDCVRLARESGADIVIGLGGGSSLDVAKLVAVLAQNDQPLSAIYGVDQVVGGRLPLVQVPTTAGTGSEVTPISIVTTGATTKMGVVAPQLYADLAFLDAELTVDLPPLHTAASGIDAMVHAIEAYTTRLKKNPVSDALARDALRLLSTNLVAACRDGSDRTAREAMLTGSTLAGQAFANAPCAAVHALAYPLGGHFHISHGLSNALMLGPVMRFNRPVAENAYAELGAVLGMGGGAEGFILGLDALMSQSGAPRRLRDAGVTAEMLPTLAADAMKQTRLLQNNPVELTEADALRLYEEAF